MTRVAIYTRVSLDRDGTKASPETQEAEARRLCQERGWDVVGLYSDRNISAFKKGAKRPEYERMLHDVAQGQIDMVVAYKLDRLTRGGMASVASLLDHLESAKAGLVTVHDNIDASTEMGRGIVGLLGSIARQESENISTRVSSAHARAAASGYPHTGGPRQFGYERDGTIRPDEAEIVREVAKRLLAGESLRQLAYDLNARGVLTTRGGPWRNNTVGQMIRSPRLAGLRRHKESLLPGNWEAILDRKTWDACIEQRAVTHRSVTAHLLTGRIYCGRCGGRLKVLGLRLKNGQKFGRYQCQSNPGAVNCGGIAIAKESLERHVVSKLFAQLTRDGLRPLDESARLRSHLEKQVADDETALVQLSQDRYVHRSLTPAEFGPARTALVSRLEASKHQLELLGDSSLDRLRPGNLDDLEGWWEGLSLKDQRAVIQASVMKVVVNPAKVRGGNRFDPSRVQIRWTYQFMFRVADAHTYTPEELAEAEAEQLKADEEMWADPKFQAEVARDYAEWLAEQEARLGRADGGVKTVVLPGGESLL